MIGKTDYGTELKNPYIRLSFDNLDRPMIASHDSINMRILSATMIRHNQTRPLIGDHTSTPKYTAFDVIIDRIVPN